MTWVCACCAWRAACGGVNTNHACVHGVWGAHQCTHVGIRMGVHTTTCMYMLGAALWQTYDDQECIYNGMHEIRGQLHGVVTLLPCIYRFWGSNTGLLTSPAGMFAHEVILLVWLCVPNGLNLCWGLELSELLAFAYLVVIKGCHWDFSINFLIINKDCLMPLWTTAVIVFPPFSVGFFLLPICRSSFQSL